MESEERITALLRERDLQAAATVAIEHYGPEVLGFLITQLRDQDDASEAFSQACEDLWKGLAAFEQRCSFRTWFYVLARHAAGRTRRPAHRAPQRRIPLSAISEVAASVQSRTLPHLRSEAKDHLATIRDSLDEADRALLVLRVDRNLDWREVACVFAGESATEEELARASARLRKRFQVVTENIRRRAHELGLLSAGDP